MVFYKFHLYYRIEIIHEFIQVFMEYSKYPLQISTITTIDISTSSTSDINQLNDFYPYIFAQIATQDFQNYIFLVTIKSDSMFNSNKNDKADWHCLRAILREFVRGISLEKPYVTKPIKYFARA